jgi:aspartate dehydrogenase
MLRVGIIGLGSIGSGIAALARSRPEDQVEVVGALVQDRQRARVADGPPVVFTLDELLGLRPDVIVDAGGHAAFRAYARGVVAAGIDLIVLSVGALADDALREELHACASASGARVRVASGAIGALDVLSAARVGGLDRVAHTVRKSARTLLGEAAEQLSEPKELYRGTAREGVARFPESANVVAAVSLAGIGFDRTEMVVIADPAATRNVHEVTAEGAFGAFRLEIQNIPSVANPKTARLAAMSAYRSLLDRSVSVQVG